MLNNTLPLTDCQTKRAGALSQHRRIKKAIPVLSFLIACLILTSQAAAIVNNPPAITNLIVDSYGSHIFITGEVVDIDSNLDNAIIYLGGDVYDSLEVDPDGSFSGVLSRPSSGPVEITIQAQDEHGNYSELITEII